MTEPAIARELAAEHERALFACALVGGPDLARALLAKVEATMIADPRLSRAWSALHRVLAAAADPGPLPEAVNAELAGDGGEAPSLVDLHALTTEVPSAANADWYARQVIDAYVRRTAVVMLSDGDLERNRDNPTAVLLAGVEERARHLRELLAGPGAERRRAVPVSEISGSRPDRLLHCTGRNGALLSVGGVLVLAGEGGIAKTPLVLSMAAGMAARPDGAYGPLHGGLFEGVGGPVLIATYEDDPAVSADRLRKLSAVWWPRGAGSELDRVHVLNMAGRPLFGPVGGDGGVAFYNARPGPLGGWDDLWSEAERIGARVVVVDPALCAYVGDANAAAPVREFMAAVTEQATAARCGVLLVAHSNKAARARNGNAHPDPFDPGNVAGSTHWTDAARGVLSLTFDPDTDARADALTLAVCKANYGPARIRVDAHPVRNRHGEIVGFANGGAWLTATERSDKAVANGAGKVDPAGIA